MKLTLIICTLLACACVPPPPSQFTLERLHYRQEQDRLAREACIKDGGIPYVSAFSDPYMKECRYRGKEAR